MFDAQQASFSFAKKVALDTYSDRYQSHEYSRLSREFIANASEYAEAQGLTTTTFLDDIAPRAMDLLQRLACCLAGSNDVSGDAVFWANINNPYDDIRLNKYPAINRHGLLQVACDYLRLPYRCRSFERLLVDGLVAVEMFGYANETMGPVSKLAIKYDPQNSPMQQPHPIVSYLKSLLRCSLFTLLPALAFFLLSDFFNLPPWSASAAVTFLLLFAVSALYITVTLPSRWQNLVQVRQSIENTFAVMVKAYLELGTNGPISTLRVREVVVSASNEGVSWPPELFAILDDNISRTGTL